MNSIWKVRLNKTTAANVKADWSTAEAADNRELKAEFAEIKELIKNGTCHLASCDRCSSVLRSGDDEGSDTV